MAIQQAPNISRGGGSRTQNSRLLNSIHAICAITGIVSCLILLHLEGGGDSYTNVDLQGFHSSHQSNLRRSMNEKPPIPTIQLSDAEILSVTQLSEEKAVRGTHRTHTDAGVDIADPELFTGVNLHGDSSTATVMGLATGYTLDVYKRFVGSLRKTGYTGHIILGVAPDVDPEVERYLAYRNVMVKKLKWVNCTYPDSKKFECSYPYNDIKTRWSRFPLQRDWLRDCKTCTGPVLSMDVRDSYFQLDPFGPGSPVVKGLQVYEEHKSQTTQHWLAEFPIRACKNVTFHETMLCSGTTTGTRVAMLKYFEVMYAEMKIWINDPKCRFTIHGDDQSMHNYLYYSGQLPFAAPIANRDGSIVNTVGVEASIAKDQQKKRIKISNKKRKRKQKGLVYDGSDGGKRWIGRQFNLTDVEGYLTEFDGSRSRVIHQYDRFGEPLSKWLKDHGFEEDLMPGEETDK